MFCTVSNKHTQITRIKQKYSNDNQKARRKIIELQPQNFIYSFQVKLNKTTYLSFKHIICRFMTESDNVADNLVFAVNSLITLYQIRHFLLASKNGGQDARGDMRGPIDIKGPTEVGLLLSPYSVIMGVQTNVSHLFPLMKYILHNIYYRQISVMTTLSKKISNTLVFARLSHKIVQND